MLFERYMLYVFCCSAAVPAVAALLTGVPYESVVWMLAATQVTMFCVVLLADFAHKREVKRIHT